MKKVLLASLAMTFALTAFTACDDDDDKDPKNLPVTASSITGADGVNKVKAVYIKTDLTRATEGGASTATADQIVLVDFTSGGFTMQLPGKVDASKLTTITRASLELPEGITMTVESFKGVSAEFEAYKDADEVGYFYESDVAGEDGTVYVEYIYSDKAFKITGTATGKEDIGEGEEPEEIDVEYTFNISASKGWNKVYFKGELIPAEGETAAKIKYTAQTASISGVKWFYEANGTPAE